MDQDRERDRDRDGDRRHRNEPPTAREAADAEAGLDPSRTRRRKDKQRRDRDRDRNAGEYDNRDGYYDDNAGPSTRSRANRQRASSYSPESAYRKRRNRRSSRPDESPGSDETEVLPDRFDDDGNKKPGVGDENPLGDMISKLIASEKTGRYLDKFFGGGKK